MGTNHLGLCIVADEGVWGTNVTTIVFQCCSILTLLSQRLCIPALGRHTGEKLGASVPPRSLLGGKDCVSGNRLILAGNTKGLKPLAEVAARLSGIFLLDADISNIVWYSEGSGGSHFWEDTQDAAAN